MTAPPRDMTALKMAAFAVAMKVKAGTLEPDDIPALRRHLQAFPDPSRPMIRAVFGFVDILDSTRDDDTRQRAARAMVAFIETSNLPVPPGQDRRDING